MIVFVDDEPRLVESYVDELKAAGFEVSVQGSFDKAAAFVDDNSSRINLVILDIMAPPGRIFRTVDTEEGLTTGLRFYERLRQQLPSVPMIVLTNASDPMVAETVGRNARCLFLRKS